MKRAEIEESPERLMYLWWVAFVVCISAPYVVALAVFASITLALHFGK